ncbi:hypothetical protein HXX76_001267 [Chlamydomonas incerta]|uniref:F-box domain-containing protein n=1 Tax=Chlamydomonas incerta TaxID=51695 RepID=A0A835WBT4_CHLIN|nr:hypothetical protein HXX76_001267 [Chlamydomonas incerta]|eukprot:KAG2444520.1 hypothetical protein HXX76_001267 [Chlamydomonas incerta]
MDDFGDELEQAFTDWDAEQDAGQDDLEANKCNNDDSEANALDAAAPGGLPTRQAPAQPADDPAPSGGPGGAPRGLHLLQLPREMLLRVLSLLPATGLTAAACACRLLADLGSEDLVWRRLYLCRWGKPEQHVRATGKQWKRTYLDADAEEWAATRRQHQDFDLVPLPSPAPAAAAAAAGGAGAAGAPSRAAGRCRAAAAGGVGVAAPTPTATFARAAPSGATTGAAAAATAAGSCGGVGLGAMFLDMLRAKRDTAPDRRLLDAQLGADPGDIAARVGRGGAGRQGRWRRGGAHVASRTRARGPAAAAAAARRRRRRRRAPTSATAGRAALTFTRVNPGEEPPVYACEQSGWVHVCGDACTEGVVDARSELLVCPVSGQTTDRLVHECEEDDGEGGRCGAGGGGGEEDGAGLGITAGFGRYFTAGYECENAQQLNRLLGYKAL